MCGQAGGSKSGDLRSKSSMLMLTPSLCCMPSLIVHPGRRLRQRTI